MMNELPIQDLAPNNLPGPPSLAQKWVRYLIGFGVSVAVGLAPYLGRVRVPLFSSLLSLIPENIQDTVLPLSAALMGIVAVVIQWYGSDKITKRWLKRRFNFVGVMAIASFLLLILVHTLVVVKVPYAGGKKSASFLVGFSRPNTPPCTAEVSDADCIQHLTFNPVRIESFWGDRQVRLAKLSLMLPYLAFTALFGMLIGLLLLKDEARVHRNTHPAE
jgi:hypothetical protein